METEEVCKNRGEFIDWIILHYPEVVKEYLGFLSDNSKKELVKSETD